ncbi:putative viral capsid [Circoviridae 4 LDMD-2013]|uniref:putative viral capsid n=1 Tax=Circoviridae 4 LDMD-2013 TaxID=1379708 RepID=UPI0003844E84|nr:putative viral capsid [Circoviridae 4 LDMD-2013]AGS36185.1 putative viral capsid [Circoviridae 4 LDMD-2013]AGS36230.1 putative viral capsid [Circoviridae 17 LDMD-2013]
MSSSDYSNDIDDEHELKFLDTTVLDSVVATTGSLTELSLVAEGVSESQRVGRRIVATSVDFIGNAYLPAVTSLEVTPEGECLRVMVLLDHQANGFATAVSEILPGTDINNHIRRTDQRRFQILGERFFDLRYCGLTFSDTGTGYDYPGVANQFHWHVPIESPIYYEEGNTRPVTGNLLLLLISKIGTAGFEAEARFNYTDN